METRHSLGETVRLFFDIYDVDIGVTDQSPLIAIRRVIDNKWFQVSDGTWQSTIVKNAMAETDVTNLPGRYHFDFDQSLDALTGSRRYIVRKENPGPNSLFEYEDLVFGALANASSPSLCSVQGTVIAADGEPVNSSLVRATVVPVFSTTTGQAVQTARVMTAYTQANGDFDLPLVRGVTVRLEIPAVGYDRKVVIPNAASVLFTDL